MPFEASQRRLVWAATIAAFVVGASGCGATGAGDASQRDARAAMKLLGMEYARFLESHGSKPPADQAEFRKFLEGRMAELGQLNVKSVDDLLVSRRDGQPLVIVCGKKAPLAPQPDVLWAAYEQTGTGGKQLACNTRGGVAELAPDQIAQWAPPAK